MSVAKGWASFFLVPKMGFRTSEGSPLRGIPRRAPPQWQGSTVAPAACAEDTGPRHLRGPGPDKQAPYVAGKRMPRPVRRRQRALAMLMLQLYDLPELELVFGTDAVQEVSDRAMAALEGVAGRTGFAVRTAPDTFALLMPDAKAEEVLEALQDRLGKPCCIEFELDGEEILTLPDVLARAVSNTETVEDVHESLRRDIANARGAEACRQDYLRRERESHTRPAQLTTRDMPNEAAPQKTVPMEAKRIKDIPAFHAALPPTVPIQLGVR